tara:strand:+ start:5918 stop:7243 length:1326 start_codon:yes stop_codon:yes gene_type:complete
MRTSHLIIILILCAWSATTWACPKLSSHYPADKDSAEDWERARIKLAGVYEQCLRSSEYFALYGAAHLNSGGLVEAIESLERALLLDPNNGAALIDYADALLRDGQLFAAIAANELLLSRLDLPSDLKLQIIQRQQNWSALAQTTSWALDLLGGFDDNLNGAPDEDLVELTLSGEPIFLKLNEQFQATKGPLLNARIQARHRRLTPDFQHTFLGQVRGRLSEDAGSDVVQFAGRYSRSRATNDDSLEWGAGINHLLFGSESLFTGADFGARYQLGNIVNCRSYVGGALQHQVWHQQRRLDGLEAKATLGTSCPLLGGRGQRLNVEGSLLHNEEITGNRLGGNRDGWQAIVEWEVVLPRGSFSAQLNHTRLLDGIGFSPLLESNARRNVRRSSVLIQYHQELTWLGGGTQFLMSFFHQNQRSNFSLFQTQDTSAEIGLRWRF